MMREALAAALDIRGMPKVLFVGTQSVNKDGRWPIGGSTRETESSFFFAHSCAANRRRIRQTAWIKWRQF